MKFLGLMKGSFVERLQEHRRAGDGELWWPWGHEAGVGCCLLSHVAAKLPRPARVSRLGWLGLPFTRKSSGTRVIGTLRVSESKSFTHELELQIALPHQLMTRLWILFAAQVSSDARNEPHRGR